jgi:hypothetical protein
MERNLVAVAAIAIVLALAWLVLGPSADADTMPADRWAVACSDSECVRYDRTNGDAWVLAMPTGYISARWQPIEEVAR